MIDLRPYQDEGTESALQHAGFAIFSEQRTGKTPIACSIIKKRMPDVLLIACPKNAVDVWTAHLAEYKIQVETKIIVLESIWRSRRKLKRWLLAVNMAMIVVDESHRAKDRHSKISRALRSLARLCDWKLILTGTPLEGKIEDAWAQFDIIDPEIFGEWKDFANRYLIYGGFKGYKIIDTQNVDEFQRKFHSRMFRVLLEDVKKIKTDISPPHQVRFDLVESKPMYESMEQKFLVELDKLGTYRRVKVFDPFTGEASFVRKRRAIVAPRVITQAMKLHQISGGFIIDEDRHVHRFGDEKLAYTGALLCALGRVPTVIIVRFLPELRRIAALARSLGRQVTLISGKHKWVAGTKFDVAVVQERSGIAIDLSRAEELIFHSWNYSYLDYDQAKFRIRSYTSTRARYHYLIANNTIDEDLYEVVTRKLKFSTYLIDKRRIKS